MKTTAAAVLSLTLLAGCDAPEEGQMAPSANAGGKNDDASKPDGDAAEEPEEPATILLPLPEITNVRATFLGLVSAGADTAQELEASGGVYGLADADCPSLFEIYGEQGVDLCKAGQLAVPVTAADRIPTVGSGSVEMYAQPLTGDALALGLPMLLLDLEAGALLQPELGTTDGTRTEVVDAVRRISLSDGEVMVWSRDPANADGPPLSGTLDIAAGDLAVVVLPGQTPQTEPGQTVDYAFSLSVECLADAACTFVRPAE